LLILRKSELGVPLKSYTWVSLLSRAVHGLSSSQTAGGGVRLEWPL